MFCKWCGKKITVGNIMCPICGKQQDALESGNGFWDLCNDKSNKGQISQRGEVQPAFRAEQNISKQLPSKNATKSNHKARVQFAPIALFVSIILLLFTLVIAGVSAKRSAECLSEVAVLRQELEDGNASGNTNDVTVPIQQELEQLSERIAKLQGFAAQTDSLNSQLEGFALDLTELKETMGQNASIHEKIDQLQNSIGDLQDRIEDLGAVDNPSENGSEILP